MRSVRMAVMALVLVTVCATGAAAQDNHTVGVTMGYPASIGLIWHVSDNVAIRPELAFTGSTSETSSDVQSLTIEGDSWAVSTGVSALFYVKKYDRVRTYVSPRFTYARSSTTTTTSGSIFTNGENTSTTNNYSFSGSFGAQYAPADRFSVFGEVGFGFGHSKGKSAVSGIEPSGNNWGTRTGVGVIFYF